MATSAMFWGAAAYNNGILPFKRSILGEAYTREGEGAAVVNPVKPNDFLTEKGILPGLTALPAWESVAPADVFRVFERGGRVIASQFPEVGLPNSSGALQKLDEPGRPDIRASNRGPATGNRIAVPLINIAKTRLNDPHLWFLGTNEQPGTTAPRVAPPAIPYTATTAIRSIPGLTLSTAARARPRRRTRPSRRRNPAIRSVTSSRARSLLRSAWSATCTSPTCS